MCIPMYPIPRVTWTGSVGRRKVERMGEKKRRLAAQNPALNRIELYVQSYQYALRALLNGIPADLKPEVAFEIATIGTAVIWPCSDGVVVLLYRDDENKITLNSQQPLATSVDQFLSKGEAASYYDDRGNRAPIHAIIKLGDASNAMVELAANTVSDGKNTFRTRYQKALIIGWNVHLPEPDVKAKEDFDFVYIGRNIGGEDLMNKPIQEIADVTATKALDLLQMYTDAINSVTREEDIQLFLSKHPEIIYPEYIACYPKWKLGEEYVTDFVFLIQGATGLEYVFVELEKPSKKIVTASGQFSAEFTQAKDQLNNWERWLTQNLNYAQQKLKGLFQPSYHLIFGRSNSLDENARQKLSVEFSGTRKTFSTYDDIRDRFEAIEKRMRA